MPEYINSLIVNPKNFDIDLNELEYTYGAKEVLIVDMNEKIAEGIKESLKENVIIKNIPIAILKNGAMYISVAGANISDVFKISKQIFSKKLPIYFSHTFEKKHTKKIKCMLKLFNKYEEDFGAAYSDFFVKIGSLNSPVTMPKNIFDVSIFSCLLSPNIAVDNAKSLSHMLFNIQNTKAVFHIADNLGEIQIKDYQKAEYEK